MSCETARTAFEAARDIAETKDAEALAAIGEYESAKARKLRALAEAKGAKDAEAEAYEAWIVCEHHDGNPPET